MIQKKLEPGMRESILDFIYNITFIRKIKQPTLEVQEVDYLRSGHLPKPPDCLDHSETYEKREKVD
ncbi:hypothetical protein SK128_019052 [Halocaridina rubra]|uniref:Uncharacterized protein n=1 Tax=Halocaridina rubra TaxID=373956 RepID=A0AAN8XIN6_HALRR